MSNVVSNAVARGLASPTALPQRVQDTIGLKAAPQIHGNPVPVDSVVTDSPLPAGVATVVRWLLNNVPTWLQITGVVLGALVALTIAFLLFRNRVVIWGWVQRQSRAMHIALAAGIVLVATGAAAAGTVSWNYTQHSNEFCTGCHVMNPAFQRFSTATNKHQELKCHDCHQQSIFASMRQLYLWVADRPQEIGQHSKVPNSVCEGCHVTGDTAKWQRVKQTAGHRVHLESDSSVLKDVKCVTCHGVEVHRFRAVDKTCGQANCHKTKDTDIVLGKMANQTVRHCTSCHGFTTDVPQLATTDSARGTLVPGKPQCLGCHEMQQVLKDFNEHKDPHGGKCGTCHNPHLQKTPQEAKNSCTNAGCHNNWRDTPFHVGESHRKVGEQCTTCHVPHASKVDASGCQACHTRVREAGKFRPPLPFDTAAALRRIQKGGIPEAQSPPAAASNDNGLPAPFPDDGGAADPVDDAPFDVSLHAVSTNNAELIPEAWNDPALSRSARVGLPTRATVTSSLIERAKADTFPHARHTKVACLECHGSGDGHGKLVFERPRGCFLCHHQEANSRKCASCHREDKYGTPKQETVTITVPNNPAKPRTVTFLHAKHTSKTCTSCHTTPVTLAPGPDKITCQDCHSDHHEARRECSACHKLADPKLKHTQLENTHQQCDACHTPTIVAKLTPTRSLCSTCHQTKSKGHYDAKECTVCHFLAAPESYRARLVTPRR